MDCVGHFLDMAFQAKIGLFGRRRCRVVAWVTGVASACRIDSVRTVDARLDRNEKLRVGSRKWARGKRLLVAEVAPRETNPDQGDEGHRDLNGSAPPIERPKRSTHQGWIGVALRTSPPYWAEWTRGTCRRIPAFEWLASETIVVHVDRYQLLANRWATITCAVVRTRNPPNTQV